MSPAKDPKKECLTRKGIQKRIKLDVKKSIGRPICLGIGPINGRFKVNWVMKVQKPLKRLDQLEIQGNFDTFGWVWRRATFGLNPLYPIRK